MGKLLNLVLGLSHKFEMFCSVHVSINVSDSQQIVGNGGIQAHCRMLNA
jgi:hypothetical protein